MKTDQASQQGATEHSEAWPYRKDHPLLLKHIRILRMFLSTCGAWPTEFFEKKTRRRYIQTFILVITCINTCGELNYLSKNFSRLEFFDLGDLYMTIFLTFLTFVRAVLPTLKSYGVLTRNFIMEFHLSHFKHIDQYYNSLYNNVNKISHYFTYLMVANMILGPVFFNLAPLYLNYKNGAYSKQKVENYTMQFSVYFLYPWYDQQDHAVITIFINLYLSYFCALLVCLIDLIMSLMAFQIIGHIKGLVHELRLIPKPKRHMCIDVISRDTNQQANLFIELFDIQENKIIREKFIDIVNHHKVIVSFAESVSDVFGPMMALTYFYQLISCALLLLECSQGDPSALTRYGPLTVIIFYQLVQISVTFEFIGSESEKLQNETYFIPWECMNESNKKLVYIFLNRVQVPIRVTALGMVEVGVQAMVGILKTTFSYFTLLKSLNE